MRPKVTEQSYDRLGTGYARVRRPDPRIFAPVAEALGMAESILNVGAGAGSYEPIPPGEAMDDSGLAGVRVVAAEPAVTMIRQRSSSAAPAVRAVAEALPFAGGSFAAGLAVLTVHHWSDWRAGLRELARVCRDRIVLFTWDPRSAGFWLATDYFPALLAADRRRFPTVEDLVEALGAPCTVTGVPVPHDCSDGFMGAYWRRPEAYLDPDVRRGISSFAGEVDPEPLARLAGDLASRRWHRTHGHLLAAEALDIGYRLIVGQSRT
jgi:SAM-dependent methyltransferase